jgi:3'-5' exoribonuclease
MKRTNNYGAGVFYAKSNIRFIATKYGRDVINLTEYILTMPEFEVWSGGGKMEHHHYGKHGLLVHTNEVIELCFSNVRTLHLTVDEIELFLSALYHDVGKIYDYEPTNTEMTEWKYTPHKTTVHHVTRSVLMWQAACIKFDIPNNYLVDAVVHNILSHHGEKQWGSPVAPSTVAAWILHLSDSTSARVNSRITNPA